MNDDRNGRTTTPEELFDHVLSIADTSQEALLEGEAVRDEARRTLVATGQSYASIMAEIAKHQKELRDSYVPATVESAVNASQRTLDEFVKGTGAILNEIQIVADKVKNRMLRHIALGTGAAALLLTAICWLLLQWVPSLDDIQKRQSDTVSLQKQISEFTSTLKGMKSRFFETNGQWYARYDLAPPVTACIDPKDPMSCATYIRVK